MKVHLKQGLWVLASPDVASGDSKQNIYSSERRIDGRRYNVIVEEKFEVTERVLLSDRRSLQGNRHFLKLRPSLYLYFERQRGHVVLPVSADVLWSSSVDTSTGKRLTNLQFVFMFLCWEFGMNFSIARPVSDQELQEQKAHLDKADKMYRKTVNWFLNQPTPNPAVLNKLVKK